MKKTTKEKIKSGLLLALVFILGIKETIDKAKIPQQPTPR